MMDFPLRGSHKKIEADSLKTNSNQLELSV